MRDGHKELEFPRLNFQRPKGIITVEICSVSKMATRRACPIEKEIFKQSTEPTQKCRIHRNL